MTWHRRENTEIDEPVSAIANLLAESPRPVFFPASYRTQKRLEALGITLPEQVVMVDPIGYEEILALMANARGVITDSGTIVEECAVLGVPSLQMRRSTERPQVYDCRSSVKFDPGSPEKTDDAERLFEKLEQLAETEWDHALGDGLASERLVADLVKRLESGTIRGHEAEHHHLPIERSYIGDGL
jgi:UDP-N-acetylglucosamine 2-epimerase